MADKYILKGKTPVAVADLHTWARWFERADRQVDFSIVGPAQISTVFLGLNHNFFNRAGPPILFETMVFGGPYDGNQDRYSTWEEAERGHEAMVKLMEANGLGTSKPLLVLAKEVAEALVKAGVIKEGDYIIEEVEPAKEGE